MQQASPGPWLMRVWQIGAPEDDDDEEGLARLWVRLTMSM